MKIWRVCDEHGNTVVDEVIGELVFCSMTVAAATAFQLTKQSRRPHHVEFNF